MADDRYNWLDKDTAERLLRGEQVSARHGDGAGELEQLLKAAAAVGAQTPGTAELPGEEAAVAAFRQAAGRGAHHRAAAEPFPSGRTARATGSVERTRLGRPFRRGFAVALAACAIGGVAVGAGTGVLPSPFRDAEPDPASSVSAAKTPGPLDTREPGAQTDGTTGHTPDPTPGGKSAGPTDTPAPGSSSGATKHPGRGTPGGGTGRDERPGHKSTGLPGSGDRKNVLLAVCQAYESGKRDGMDRDTLRRLERKAGGADKVHLFCRAYLARYQDGGSSGSDDGFGGSIGGAGQSGGSGGDEDDDAHPSQTPGSTPGSGTSTPAPTPSVTTTEPGDAAPSDTVTP
ncbi:hypothetical protein OG229_14435 [Streptomyces platensis]|uniref:hypothetical protein n=1 Tax=Streptomyces platensis TaxID=58346 RepID=UPI002E11D094|nr:hypothetical protein OG229_14435 [Streptomyces platensis]